MTEAVRAASVEEVLALYARWGDERYDEDVTQSAHALQVAGHALAAGAAPALVVAALLHDVGHLLAMARRGDGAVATDVDLRHEAVGARWLAGLFPPEVTGPIALHVQAKRYRCGVDPAALDVLSEGSRASLIRQGGPMDATEARRFEGLRHARAALALRTWDDAGKVVGAPVDADVAAHRARLLAVTTTGVVAPPPAAT